MRLENNIINIRDKYITELYAQEELSHMKQIWESCPERLRHMQISAMEGNIIQVMLQLIQANKVLELGTLVGYSAAWIASGLSGDKPTVISVEKSLEHYTIAKQNIVDANLDYMIYVLHSDALSVLEYYAGDSAEIDIIKSIPDHCKQGNKFDAMFIDAMKSEYINYLPYVKKCLRKGGLLIVDNTLLFDEIYKYRSVDAIQDKKLAKMWMSVNAFNQEIAADEDFTSVILPTSQGMTLAVRQ